LNEAQESRRFSAASEVLNFLLAITVIPVFFGALAPTVANMLSQASGSPDFNVTFQRNANGSSMTVVEIQLMDTEPTTVEKIVVNGSKECRVMTADPSNVFSGMAPLLDALRKEKYSTQSSPPAPPRSDILKMGDRRRIVSANCEPVQVEIVTDRGTSAYIKNKPISRW
jgi:hypothetical protein